MQLILDTREPVGLRRLVATAVKEKYRGVTIIELALETGDALVQAKHGAFLVERKTTNDLVASLTDGRLKSQVNRLVQVKNVLPMLIVHGDTPRIGRDGKLYTSGRGKTGLNYWSLQMAVASIQFAGIPVWVIGGEETLNHKNLYPEAICCLMGYGNKKSHNFITGSRYE